ncbi:uncharacterized protein FTOL_13892 [Fusarium torulosum]|uniref:Uncharacterized protein n=1 Tax=Fusarium torulosum TaxID=33205 RepID=A0AAE8SQA3_9HYPO|nr:uncharacterized protein FTOL_13892 [Fusarium torulosum]
MSEGPLVWCSDTSVSGRFLGISPTHDVTSPAGEQKVFAGVQVDLALKS